MDLCKLFKIRDNIKSLCVKHPLLPDFWRCVSTGVHTVCICKVKRTPVICLPHYLQTQAPFYKIGNEGVFFKGKSQLIASFYV